MASSIGLPSRRRTKWAASRSWWAATWRGNPASSPIVSAVLAVPFSWSFDRRRPELWIVVDVGELEEMPTLWAVPVFLDHPSLADSLVAATAQAGPAAPEPGEEPDHHRHPNRPSWRERSPGSSRHRAACHRRPAVPVLCPSGRGRPRPARGTTSRSGARSGQPRVWEVGYRIGTALRQPQPTDPAGNGQHRTPLTHLRRAHWHTYWVGSRAEPDQRQRELRWIQPTLIGTGKLTTTVRDLG